MITRAPTALAYLSRVVMEGGPWTEFSMFQICCLLTPIRLAAATAVMRPIRISTSSRTSPGTGDSERNLDVEAVLREVFAEDVLRERDTEFLGEATRGAEEDVEVMRESPGRGTGLDADEEDPRFCWEPLKAPLPFKGLNRSGGADVRDFIHWRVRNHTWTGPSTC